MKQSETWNLTNNEMYDVFRVAVQGNLEKLAQRFATAGAWRMSLKEHAGTGYLAPPPGNIPPDNPLALTLAYREKIITEHFMRLYGRGCQVTNIHWLYNVSGRSGVDVTVLREAHDE